MVAHRPSRVPSGPGVRLCDDAEWLNRLCISAHNPNTYQRRVAAKEAARRGSFIIDVASAGLKAAAVIMARIRVIRRCTRGRFAPTPALWRAPSHYRPRRAIAAGTSSKCFQLFRVFRGRALLLWG
jgi:hypothetical protein